MAANAQSTDAARMRRVRAHKKGDHQLCTPKTCDVALDAVRAPVQAEPPPDPGDRAPGGIERAVVAFVATLPYQSPDPRALMAEIAVRVAQRVDETGAMPAAVRELRTMLSQLVEVPNQPSGQVDVLRLQTAQRHLDQILATYRAA